MQTITINDIKKRVNANIVQMLIPFIIWFAFAIVFFGLALFLTLNKEKAYTTSAGLIFLFLFPIILLLMAAFFFIQLRKNLIYKKEINKMKFIVEEDKIYDHVSENDYSSSDSSNVRWYYIFGEKNGKIHCNYKIYDLVRNGDMVYVVKLLNYNEILDVYKKDNVILDNELQKLVKWYNR